MNKAEFLQQLDEHLMGNVSESERIDSIRYYREYIEEEIRSGRREEEVLDSLGSAYGIAKSIIEANGYDSGERNDYEEYRASSNQDIYREDEASYERKKEIKATGLKAWLTIGGILLVIFLILSLVFHVFVALIPFIVPFLFAIFVIKMFTKR